MGVILVDTGYYANIGFVCAFFSFWTPPSSASLTRRSVYTCLIHRTDSLTTNYTSLSLLLYTVLYDNSWLIKHPLIRSADHGLLYTRVLNNSSAHPTRGKEKKRRKAEESRRRSNITEVVRWNCAERCTCNIMNKCMAMQIRILSRLQKAVLLF